MKPGRFLAALAGLSATAVAAVLLVAPGSAQAAPGGLPNYPRSVYCYGASPLNPNERVQIHSPRRQGNSVAYRYLYQTRNPLNNSWNTVTSPYQGSPRSGDLVALAYSSQHRPGNVICGQYTFNKFKRDVVESWN